MHKILFAQMVPATSGSITRHICDIATGENVNLENLLHQGWKIIETQPTRDSHTFLMVMGAPEKPGDDVPLARWNTANQKNTQFPGNRNWDGETINLAIFGVK
jgi:hypothetical protein